MTRRLNNSIACLLSVAALSTGCTGEISGSGDRLSGGSAAGGVRGEMPEPGGPSGPNTSLPGTGGPTGPSPTGPSGTPTPPTPPSGPLRALDLAPARARRLTTVEIRNSVADIFFAGSVNRVPVLEGPTVEGFSNNIQANNVGLSFMESLDTFATDTAAAIIKDLARLAPCNVAMMGAPACAAAFITSYGPLVYRRPLDALESARLRDTFAAAARSGTFEQGLEAVIQVMLMAPHFLFRTELGAAKDPSGAVTLTAHERAAALSYGFWQTTPDAQLMAAAESGALMTAAGLRAETKRLAASPRVRPVLRSFVREWLGIDPTAVTKDDKATFTGSVASDAAAEIDLFVDEALGRSDGALNALWTSTRSFATARLAKLYGVGDVTSTKPVPIDLPVDQQRGGILSLVGFIASHTPALAFSPIEIALTVRDRVFCVTVPVPPAAVPDPPTNPLWSVREKLARHRADPACSGCHKLLDPLGFGFERLGVTGVYRTVEPTSGAMLTGDGELNGTDVDGRFVGPAELGRKAAASAGVQHCVAAQGLGYLVGREASYSSQRTPADELALQGVFARGVAGDVRGMLAELAASEAFVRRDGSRLP